MPHGLPLLDDLLILLVASIPIAFICHRLRLPVIVGFMITGVIIGPMDWDSSRRRRRSRYYSLQENEGLSLPRQGQQMIARGKRSAAPGTVHK